MKEKEKKRYLFFDIECANPYIGTICEFGYVITDEDLNIIESNNLYLNPKSKYDWYAAKNILAFSKNFYNSQKDFRYHYNEIKRVFESVDFVFGYACLNDLTYLKKEFKRYNCKDIDFKTFEIQDIIRYYTNAENVIGLEKAMSLFMIQNDGILHHAKDDAINSMKIVKHIKESLDTSLTLLMGKVNLNFKKSLV